jgi:hypothetical protein
MIFILAVVILMAGVTIWLAWAWMLIGAPVWQAAIGPLALTALVVLKWIQHRNRTSPTTRR